MRLTPEGHFGATQNANTQNLSDSESANGNQATLPETDPETGAIISEMDRAINELDSDLDYQEAIAEETAIQALRAQTANRIEAGIKTSQLLFGVSLALLFFHFLAGGDD